MALTGKDVPFVWRSACVTAFTSLRDALVRAPILAFPTETGDYILDTDASNFGQIQDDVECVITYCSRALRPSQRKYCTTKREMSPCVYSFVHICVVQNSQFGWLHRFKDTDGMMARWLHTLQQFQFSIVHRAGHNHGNADGLSRVPTSPCGQCTRVDCPDIGIRSDVFPAWAEVKSLYPELRFLWHHQNNLSADANGVIWRKRSSQGSQLQLLVPRPAREQLFLAYRASLFGGRLRPESHVSLF